MSQSFCSNRKVFKECFPIFLGVQATFSALLTLFLTKTWRKNAKNAQKEPKYQGTPRRFSALFWDLFEKMTLCQKVLLGYVPKFFFTNRKVFKECFIICLGVLLTFSVFPAPFSTKTWGKKGKKYPKTREAPRRFSALFSDHFEKMTLCQKVLIGYVSKFLQQ